MSRKNKKNVEQGTYALCITIGLIIGVGFGPIMGNLLVTCIIGAAAGAGAGYYFNSRRRKARH